MNSQQDTYCIAIPFYRHQHAIQGLVTALKPLGLKTYLVDDGSGPECEEVLSRIAGTEHQWLHLIRNPVNGGKGAALRSAFDRAAQDGYTHAIQIDADHQHDPAEVSKLMALSARHPDALITGTAVYDQSVPRARKYGRYVTHFWVWVNTLSLSIKDSMCGFRIYPLQATLAVYRQASIGVRMEFDTEIMVRLYWAGTRVVGTPTRVLYPADGVSHFRMWQDNLRISCMHTRLFFGMLRRLPSLLQRKFAKT